MCRMQLHVPKRLEMKLLLFGIRKRLIFKSHPPGRIWSFSSNRRITNLIESSSVWYEGSRHGQAATFPITKTNPSLEKRSPNEKLSPIWKKERDDGRLFHLDIFSADPAGRDDKEKKVTHRMFLFSSLCAEIKWDLLSSIDPLWFSVQKGDDLGKVQQKCRLRKKEKNS